MKTIKFFIAIALAMSILIFLFCPTEGQINENGYCFSSDPAPYLEKTAPDKRNVWFDLKEDHWCINWDAERLPFDKIFLHCAKSQSIEEMNEIFKTFYINRFNSNNNDPYVKGLTPHSGHIFKGKETYLVYHYVIYRNGEVVQTLKPLIKIDNKWYIDQVAWHANNWTDNCRSVSVCLISDNAVDITNEQSKSLESLIKAFEKVNPELKLCDCAK